MELDDYQAQALRTAGEKCKGSIPYSMGGVGGEAGEYVDVCKKHLFHDVPHEKSKPLALKELGDLLWGIAQAADAWGLSLSEVAAANIEKIKARYPKGWSAEAARERADEKPTVERLTYRFDANGSPVEEPQCLGPGRLACNRDGAPSCQLHGCSYRQGCLCPTVTP